MQDEEFEKGGGVVSYGLAESVIERIKTVFSHYQQIEQALLYGSRAKGSYREGSDIDLTLVGGEDLTSAMLTKVIDELDDLLLPYVIDLSLLRNITDIAVLDHIKRVGVAVYEKDGNEQNPAD